MPLFNIYFQVYNKKMKTRVEAKDVWEARAIVLKSVKIIKGEEAEDPIAAMGGQTLQNLKDIFGIK